ncbi:hypothetical protein ABEX32_13355 [Brevibacillus fortis]
MKRQPLDWRSSRQTVEQNYCFRSSEYLIRAERTILIAFHEALPCYGRYD